MTAFDRRPFLQAHRDIRDLVSMPVLAWMAFSPARKTSESYRELLDIPMDLAGAGFEVTAKQDGQGWHIDLSRDLGNGVVLELNGAARSYASALFQLANDADTAIDDLQRKARTAWERDQEREAAA